ncbi:LacI family DNA-binding transcriptional regulator [Negadavirga shengliensis]|uniref:LacI family DNA-binding transcriptional regulator n=1 Tax=Negadavirga shengliensis TaxID=1389218 RepID=A0ABV9T509_9BACT
MSSNKKKKPTILDIAEKLKITPSTVSRALNNHPRISEETRRQVIRVANELNYQPNNIASALRSGKSKLIGIVVPTVNRNFFSSVVRGIEEYAEALNYNVIISQSHEDHKKEVQTIKALISARVDGIIASLGKNTTDFSHFQMVIDKGIPLVLFDRVTDKLNVSKVVIDDHQGAFEAVSHLIDQGCTRIVHLTNPRKINIYSERLRGYTDALRANGLPVLPELIVESNMQLEDGRDSVKQLLEKGIAFDAIFSASDYAIMGAMQILDEKGLKVPNDIKLVGFGNEPFTSFTQPPITTVDQKSIPMGQVTAETFFDLLNKDAKQRYLKTTVLKPELVIRGSSISKAEVPLKPM